MILTLSRDYRGEDCTLGQLEVPFMDKPLQTLERPWVDLLGYACGDPNKSCVPAATYDLVPHNTEAHPYTWGLQNAELRIFAESPPAGWVGVCRTEIHIDIANYVSELLGCIAVGTRRDCSGGAWEVLNSRIAFGRLQQFLPWTSGHQLVIQ